MKTILQFVLVLYTLSSCHETDIHAQTGVVSGKITVDNHQRTYLLNAPAARNDTGQPLVVVLHGGGGSAAQCEHSYGWTDKSNRENFIVVYPEGVQSDRPLKLRTWNAGRCCDYASENNIDDVKFIAALIDHLGSKYRVDPKKIYVTGMSNGAMMAYRMACEMPGKIAAIAAVSGPLMTTQPCNPSRAMPVLHIHSERDSKVPYAGGKGIFDYRFSSVDSTLRVWAAVNHCDTIPLVQQKETHTVYQWRSGNAPLQAYITKDGGHSWPGGKKPRARADDPSQAFDATDVIWNFFKEQELQ